DLTVCSCYSGNYWVSQELKPCGRFVDQGIHTDPVWETHDFSHVALMRSSTPTEFYELDLHFDVSVFTGVTELRANRNPATLHCGLLDGFGKDWLHQLLGKSEEREHADHPGTKVSDCAKLLGYVGVVAAENALAVGKTHEILHRPGLHHEPQPTISHFTAIDFNIVEAGETLCRVCLAA
ncbi:MAG: hypothetical protein AAF413_01265, partial [Patescibacteria group bacterium]